MIFDSEFTRLTKLWTEQDTFVPFKFSGGIRNAKIAFVGEAWGETEEQIKRPFMGNAGAELAKMMMEAGLGPHFQRQFGRHADAHMISHWMGTGYFYTNVFAERPPSNNLLNWCVKKAELPKDYQKAPWKQAEYIHPFFLPHLARLIAEIKEVKPNLVVLLGNTACWALLNQTSISKIRGTVCWSSIIDCKVLPTYHPSAVFSNWSLRPIVLQDFMKAKREREFAEIRRPERWITTNPTMDDIYYWMTKPAEHYAVDIETTKKQISMIGFARSKDDALVVPFINPDGTSYWSTQEDEVRAWKAVKELLERSVPKIFQNGLYDLSYIVKLPIRPVNCIDDTMLLHHSLFPEMLKGLGFLGSVYTDEVSWKLMRERKKEAEKKDE